MIGLRKRRLRKINNGQKTRSLARQKKIPENNKEEMRCTLVQRSHVGPVDVDFVAIALSLQGLCQHELAHPVDPLVFGGYGKVLHLAIRHNLLDVALSRCSRYKLKLECGSGS